MVLDCDRGKGICYYVAFHLVPITPFSFLSNQNKPNQKGLGENVILSFLIIDLST